MMTDPTLADVILVGLAAASLFKLANVDKITQPLRYRIVPRLRRTELTADGAVERHPPRSGWANWLEYLWGCALCFPMWCSIALVLAWGWPPTRLVAAILAARFVAWMALRWLQEANVRDWPSGYNWPPDESDQG